MIKHERPCLRTFPNISKFVKNAPLRVVFSTLLDVWKCGQTRDIPSQSNLKAEEKTMLIKIRYRNTVTFMIYFV